MVSAVSRAPPPDVRASMRRASPGAQDALGPCLHPLDLYIVGKLSERR
jgi:hypothetical protein